MSPYRDQPGHTAGTSLGRPHFIQEPENAKLYTAYFYKLNKSIQQSPS